MKKTVMLLSVIAAAGTGVSYAGEHTKAMKMDREQMAQVHQQMADCLRSDRDIQECRDQMKQAMRKEKRKGVGGTGDQSEKGMGSTSDQPVKNGMGSTSDQPVTNGTGATGSQSKNGTGATGDQPTEEGASEESSSY